MSGDERLTLPVWDGLTSAEREDAARAVADRLPVPFAFKGLKIHSLAGQTHEVAFYGWKRSTFALLPGGAVTLGFDAKSSGFPDVTQQENWGLTEESLGWSLDDFLEEAMTLPRTTVLSPYLIEVSPTALAEYTDWHQVSKRVEKAGFALPTPDQWEYACGAGSDTLFRWGSSCPLDVLPIDKSDWKLHQQPNAFGLRMPANPYRWELTSEPAVMRGGDGGSTICGGMGELAGWLPLATAFTITWENEYEIIGAYLRRVFLLD